MTKSYNNIKNPKHTNKKQQTNERTNEQTNKQQQQKKHHYHHQHPQKEANKQKTKTTTKNNNNKTAMRLKLYVDRHSGQRRGSWESSMETVWPENTALREKLYGTDTVPSKKHQQINLYGERHSVVQWNTQKDKHYETDTVWSSQTPWGKNSMEQTRVWSNETPKRTKDKFHGTDSVVKSNAPEEETL